MQPIGRADLRHRLTWHGDGDNIAPFVFVLKIFIERRHEMKEKKKAVEEEEQIQATEESTEEKDEGLSLKTAIKAGPMLDIDG